MAAKLDRAASTVGPGSKVIALDDLDDGVVREELGKLKTAPAVGAGSDEGDTE